jgi:hypothetical protein
MTSKKRSQAKSAVTLSFHFTVLPVENGYRLHISYGEGEYTTGPVLAYLLFGPDQRTTAPNVLRRSATGWDGCCAECVAPVGVGERNGLKRTTRWVPSPLLEN